jgi:hypothetical protein
MMRLSVAATLVLSLAVAVAAGPGTRNAAAACTVPTTAYDDTAQADSNLLVYNGQWVGQSFKLSSGTILNKVMLYLRQNGATTDSITVQIQGDTGGKPNGTVLGTRTLTLTSPTYAFIEFDFSSDHISLAAGTPYQIVASNTYPSFGGGYNWAGDANSPTYLDGAASFSTDQGTSWTTSTSNDMLFEVFGSQTCTADPKAGGTNNNAAQAVASNLGVSNESFAAEASGPSAYVVRRKAPLGTGVSFNLNEAATVRFTVSQSLKGRKVKHGKKTVCAKPTKQNRKKKSCTRVVTLKGSFSRIGIAGKNSFHFTGRLNGRKLKPGRYHLVATPSAGGKTGKPTSSSFRIVR